jgi:glycosyltransferase involved in cell wall biosynthesis
MSRPLVSILIPAYNAEPWIEEAIRSALAQTWPHKEIIVVDDGSTDGTLAVAQRFATTSSVRVVAQKNRGASAARNAAFAVSKGDYIQWLDADDVLAPDKLERQLKTHGTDADRRMLFSCCWGVFIYRTTRAQFAPSSLWRDLSPTDFLLCKLRDGVFMQTSVWLVSRELSVAAGPWDEQMLVDDDGEYFCRVLMASKGIRFVPEAKVFYRYTGSGRLSSTGCSDRKLEVLWRSKRLHIAYLRSLEDSDRTRDASIRLLQRYLAYYHESRPDIVDEMRCLANELGGQLTPPRMSWKYDWLRRLVGWRIAKRAEMLLPTIRWGLKRRWDRTMFRTEQACGVTHRQAHCR